MGLASGQARLLSITARLTDNEYRSQRLTNARLNLEKLSEDARIDYQEALSNNKFVYLGFNSSGKKEKTDLTPTVLWQYQPRKNQYAVINQAGNILVSNLDAKNYRETDNLAEFLKRYDCLENYGKTETIIEQVKERNKDYDNWVAPEQLEPETVFDDKLAEIFKNASKHCYNNAHSLNKCDCYLHVLAHMLILVEGENYNNYDPNISDYTVWVDDLKFYEGDLKTSTGAILDNSNSLNKSSPKSKIYGSNINYGAYSNAMIDISVALREGYEIDGKKYTVMAHELEDYEGRVNMSDETKKLLSDEYIKGESPSDFQILMSNYYKDNDGNIKLKTLQQKSIDVYYLVNDFYMEEKGGNSTCMFGGNNREEWSDNYLNNYVPLIETLSIDMESFLLDEFEPQENPYEEYIYNSVPKTKYTEELTIKDPEKAQWYTNLWYRMNGMDEPERIYKDINDVVNDRQEDTTRTDYLLKLFDIEKNTYKDYYEVLPENLAESNDWLNNALAQGWVTLQKAGASRTVDTDKFKWSDIIYTNATDIITEENSEAIAKAEAKYSQILSDIDSQDKRYQMQIRCLDSEHNALQTEYNSVKSAVDKNVDRSFKVFQG